MPAKFVYLASVLLMCVLTICSASTEGASTHTTDNVYRLYLSPAAAPSGIAPGLEYAKPPAGGNGKQSPGFPGLHSFYLLLRCWC